MVPETPTTRELSVVPNDLTMPSGDVGLEELLAHGSNPAPKDSSFLARPAPMANPSPDPSPGSITMIRRRLLSASPEPETPSASVPDPASETIDFDSVNGSGLLF